MLKKKMDSLFLSPLFILSGVRALEVRGWVCEAAGQGTRAGGLLYIQGGISGRFIYRKRDSLCFSLSLSFLLRIPSKGLMNNGARHDLSGLHWNLCDLFDSTHSIASETSP